MSIKVALHHHTGYKYDRPVSLGPQVIRLRPAPHCRTPIESYSLRVSPENHFINWQQDPHGNFLARVVFDEKVTHLSIDVDLVANLSVINPFDFFIEEAAEKFPFEYKPEELEELKPYLVKDKSSELLREYLKSIDRNHDRTIDFLVALNQKLQESIRYVVRMEPGVQTCDQTLELRSGSCRDSAWLLVQILRHLGFAARFTSGYLIQLKPDVKSLDGPSGTEVDFTDLHAWTEVFLPGAGWVGLDPTSGLFTGEGHLPLASTPKFTGAAAISGGVEECETEFDFDMSIERVHEDPRVTKPYTDQQWEAIDQLGYQVDQQLVDGDVRLTMGGEPTFVSIDSPNDPQWQTEALGEEKNRLANDLMTRMKRRFGFGALLHYGQGKWYPGEPLPRWGKTCYVRQDGQPLWDNQELLAAEDADLGHSFYDAMVMARQIAGRLGLAAENVSSGYEDALYHLWEEQRLPANVDLEPAALKNKSGRKRLAEILDHGLDEPVGCVLPLQYQSWGEKPGWVSGPWVTRSNKVNLIPGDSPMGYRLPIKSLVRVPGQNKYNNFFDFDPTAARAELPAREELRAKHQMPGYLDDRRSNLQAATPELVGHALAHGGDPSLAFHKTGDSSGTGGSGDGGLPSQTPAHVDDGADLACQTDSSNGNGRAADLFAASSASDGRFAPAIPFALCVEPRGGTLHVFMPPTERLEHYLEVLAAVEDTAADLKLPVVIEGYKPPSDHRVKHFSITPDPGVIEVNVQPAETWDELKEITEGLYEDAYQSRLGTEKFELDGQHSGTGGGNHIVLGGKSPADSPLLRRPDLLRSLVGYWQNHPSLSYLFSGRFIGSTSQAPRVDEARADSLYELQIAFDELERQPNCQPWLVDRLFRNLLIDVTGNTHRAEFCIDKLYSPDSVTGRLGLLEFRGFEMPPHERMSLTQQLLLRTLVARFWKTPYTQPLVDWKTRLHDQFMLPHFVWRDFEDVMLDCQAAGYAMKADWFEPHFEFRFPHVGGFTHNSVSVSIRQAIEPWNVLGEEATGTGTSRYVDSSIERMQVKVNGYVDERYSITCNGRTLPFHPTDVRGQYVAGVRYRAWQPPSCLHPTIPVDGPLTFDLYDNWLGRSVDGCRYHVGHPGGLNPSTLPVNSYEAESRRAARFTRVAHNGVAMKPREGTINRDFPMTLDLRKDRT